MRRAAQFLVAAFWMASPAFAQVAPPPPQGPPVIVTSGDAILKRAPDQAWVSIAAESRAPAAADAQRANAEAMRAVTAAITKAGISSDAVRTSSYSLQPDMEYQNGRARVRGYIARNQVEVRVDDLQRLSAVIDAAGSSGATSMSGLRFDIKDRSMVEREALKQAVGDAISRARAIADGAKATLGAVLRIDEHGEVAPPMPVYRTAMAVAGADAAPTPVSPGEIEIRARVTLTIAIK